MAARLAGIKTILSSRHNDDRFRQYAVIKWGNRLLARQHVRIIAISDWIAEFVHTVEGIPAEKIVRIHYGIDPERLQGDGWGIGFYVNGHPRLVKSKGSVYMEYEALSSAVRHARSRVILAHIRRASNPRGLPREKLMGEENSQPFSYERYIFAHNGIITIPDELAGTLGSWRGRIRGLNDSEVYFWFLMKELHEGMDLASALRRLEETLEGLWEEARQTHQDKKQPYVGLNMILSDGKCLYAYCGHGDYETNSKSLCFGDQPMLEMSYVLGEDRLVVASEKTNREEDWKPINDGELLISKISNGEIVIEVEEIP